MKSLDTDQLKRREWYELNVCMFCKFLNNLNDAYCIKNNRIIKEFQLTSCGCDEWINEEE